MNRDSNNLSSEELSEIELIRDYWNKKPHEYQVSKSPPGSIEYFQDIKTYHDSKVIYLSNFIDFGCVEGKKILEIGCGMGTLLVSFAKAGAIVTGVDISDLAVEMSKKNLEIRNLRAEVFRDNGEFLNFDNNSFDCIVALATISYASNPKRMVKEIHRVLKKGGEAYLAVYNSNSWLNFLFKTLNKKPPREEAPAFNQFSEKEFGELLKSFSIVEITTDRFPIKTKQYTDALSLIYNTLFVPAFSLIPKKFLKSYGHHIIAKVVK